jgi:hypothetical protein
MFESTMFEQFIEWFNTKVDGYELLINFYLQSAVDWINGVECEDLSLQLTHQNGRHNLL